MKKHILYLIFACSLCQISLAQNLYSPIEHFIDKGHIYQHIAVADWDGDGMDELAVASQIMGEHKIDIFDVAADGEITLLQSLDGGGVNDAPIALDYDNDGDLDLVTGMASAVVGFENMGNGTFADYVYLFNEGTPYLDHIDVVDYDNDGDLDIIMQGIAYFFLENDNGTFVEGQYLIHSCCNYEYDFADLDGDGDLDMFQKRNQGEIEHTLIFSYNNNGVFSDGDTITVPNTTPYNGAIHAFDYDNDGDIDISFFSQDGGFINLIIAENAGDNLTFSVITNLYYDLSDNATNHSFEDIDSDGDFDIISPDTSEDGHTWLRNDNGTFVAVFVPFIELGAAEPSSLLRIEIDGDAGIEIAAVSRSYGRVYTYDYDDTQNNLIFKDIEEPTLNQTQAPLLGDMDNDGDKDIVAFSSNNNNITWYENELPNEDNTPHLISSYEDFLGAGLLVDLNGDDYLDVVCVNRYPSFNEGSVYMNQPGTGDFSAPTTILSDRPFELFAFDIDSDGDNDIIYPFNDGYSFAENLDGNGTIAAPVQFYYTGYSTTKINFIPVDFNSDGNMDFVTFHRDGVANKIVIIENDGNTNFTSTATLAEFALNVPIFDIQMADMNGDGNKDIVYETFSNPTAASEIGIIYASDNMGNFYDPIVLLNDNFQNGIGAIYLEDIDNDGDTDIVSDLDIWLENDANLGTFIQGQAAQNVYSSGLYGLCDFDEDGDLDFLLRNEQALYWSANTNIHNFWLSGNISTDENKDCAENTDDFDLEDWMITAEHEDYYIQITTDENGDYFIPVDSGEWVLNAVPISAYWDPCFEDSLIVMPSAGAVINTDFYMQPNGECGYIDWNTSGDRLRPCESNNFSVSLCNRGVEVSEDMIIEVQLDPFLYFQSASHPYTVGADSIYYFNIDSLGINECDQIFITAFLDCDSASLFELQCVSFQLLPAEICAPDDSEWDGSVVEVDGVCEGDSISFAIRNISPNNMTMPSQVRVEIINDDIVMMHDVDEIQLGAMEEIELVYLRQGAGMRLSVDQSMDFPLTSEAAVIVPNCEDIANNVILNTMPADDGNPFAQLACEPVFASYDPNDKSAIPMGLGDDHEIEKDWNLDYRIRFQNTGNDTAFLVVLRDTISEHLDLTTLQMGASSHLYTYEVNLDRELKITFANIILPDSTTNLAASQGYIHYTMSPSPDILTGTVIENTAHIYFDFNDPIVTNTAFHTIRRPVVASSEHVEYCAGNEDYPIDTTLIEEIALLEYDSLHFTHIDILPIEETMQLSTVSVGTVIGGVTVTSDTTFIEIVQDSNGCDAFIHHEIMVTTSVVSLDFENVNIFPNPTLDELNIINHNNNETQNWRLLNSTGQLIWSKTLKQNEIHNPISMQMHPSGMYWLEVKTDTGYGIWKVVKR